VGGDVQKLSGGTQSPYVARSFFGEFFFYNPREYGSLRVSAVSNGRLFVDGRFVEEVEGGTATVLNNVAPGSRTVEVRYEDHTESMSVEVEDSAVAEARFTYNANPSFTLVHDIDIPGVSIHLPGRSAISAQAGRIEGIPAGEYRATIGGPYIDTVTLEIEGSDGETVSIAPQLRTYGSLVLEGSIPEDVEIRLGTSLLPPRRRHYRVPTGNHTLRIQGEAVRPFSKEITVSYAQTLNLAPTLELREGAIRLQGAPANAEVTIDGREISVDSDGHIAGIAVGTREVEVRHDAWPAPVSVETTVRDGETVGLALPTGRIRAEGVPDDARFYFEDSRRSFPVDEQEDGALVSVPLPEGRYQLEIRGRWITTEKESVDVVAGEIAAISFAPAYQGVLEVELPESDSANVEITVDTLADGESASPLISMFAQRRFRLAVGQCLVKARYADDSEYTFESLATIRPGETTNVVIDSLDYSAAYKIGKLEREHTTAMNRYQHLLRRQRVRGTTSWVFLVAGLAGGGLGTYTYFQGVEAKAAYDAARTTAEATEARGRIEELNRWFQIASVGTASAISLSAIFRLFRPRTRKTESRLQSIEDQIELLKEEQ
jgi:hypothetical protein